MKFLTFGDVHGGVKSLKSVISRSKKKDIDFLVCLGDLSNFGRGLRENLKVLNEIGKKIYFIPGNHEEHLEKLNELLAKFENFIDFDQKEFEMGNYVFLGYGKGGFASKDAEFRKLARRWYGKYNGKKIILILHGPPFGTKVDFLEDHGHVGNKDFRAFIERIKPKVVVCGHLHENEGIMDKIGKSRIINPGYEGMVVELK